MLDGIHPLLAGPLLAVLDAMGHADSIVIADAHFPAERFGGRVLSVAAGVPELTRAIRTVLPLDEAPAVDAMADDGAGARPDGRLAIHAELEGAAGVPVGGLRLLDRGGFYAAAAEAFAIVRTIETRAFGNVLLRKGLAVPLRL
jgi:L-fucose mutarotase